jgi:hypothetical protein
MVRISRPQELLQRRPGLMASLKHERNCQKGKCYGQQFGYCLKTILTDNGLYRIEKYWKNESSFSNFRAASGEIDIMESRGERPNKIIGTIHYGGTSPNNIYSSSGEKEFPVDFSANYHKFAVEWNAKEIKWLLDEKEYYSQNINRSMYSGQGTNPYTKSGQPFDQPFHWILNVAVGGVFFPSNVYGPQVTPEEAKQWAKPTMEVDYVRVSQWKD